MCNVTLLFSSKKRKCKAKGNHLHFKRILNIIFDKDSSDKLDLFEVFPRLKRFFVERHLHAAIRTVGDLVFTLIIISGLFGPQEPDRNCSLFLSWGLWWPTVVLSWFFVGRMWCGFCPFPGLGRIFQRLGLSFNRPLPRALQKYGVYWSVVLLAIIIWLEESTGIKESPFGTALLLLAILFGATICAIIFPKQAWCRYLCPMGRIIGVAATLSITEFRPDHDKCRDCKTFACKRGTADYPGCPVYLGAFNVRNNLYCLVCGHCMKLCDKDSPQLNIRSPFTELIINKGRFITCSYIIPFLMGSQLARFIQEGHLNNMEFCNGVLFCSMGILSLLLLVFFFFAYFIIRLGAYLFGVTEDELFGKFSPLVPIFVPMAFAGELVYRVNYAIKNAPDFLPTVGRQFGWDLEHMTFTVPSWVIAVMDLGVSAISGLASFYRL